MASIFTGFEQTELNNAVPVLANVLATEQLSKFASKGISDLDDEAFVEHLASKLTPIMLREHALPAGFFDDAPRINLFGYGRVRQVLTKFDRDTGKVTREGYFWGHEAAEALGWDGAQFAQWCDLMRGFDLSEQRHHDEETGELGWDHLLYHPMGVSVWVGDDKSDDHMVNGSMSGPIMRYWADLYLIDTDRLMAMMSASPWSKEFMDNVIPLMSYAFKNTGLEERAKDVPTYQRRENSFGETTTEVVGSMADMFARDREGITEQEATERAMRGPVLPEDLGGSSDE
jgi:hypothetical protein